MVSKSGIEWCIFRCCIFNNPGDLLWCGVLTGLRLRFEIEFRTQNRINVLTVKMNCKRLTNTLQHNNTTKTQNLSIIALSMLQHQRITHTHWFSLRDLKVFHFVFFALQHGTMYSDFVSPCTMFATLLFFCFSKRSDLVFLVCAQRSELVLSGRNCNIPLLLYVYCYVFYSSVLLVVFVSLLFSFRRKSVDNAQRHFLGFGSF